MTRAVDLEVAMHLMRSPVLGDRPVMETELRDLLLEEGELYPGPECLRRALQELRERGAAERTTAGWRRCAKPVQASLELDEVR